MKLALEPWAYRTLNLIQPRLKETQLLGSGSANKIFSFFKKFNHFWGEKAISLVDLALSNSQPFNMYHLLDIKPTEFYDFLNMILT